MKKSLFILSLLLVIGAEFAVAQVSGIQSVNGWKYVGTYASWIDSTRTRSFINGEGQVFGTYGSTSFKTGTWTIQTTWSKWRDTTISMPDSISIDAKFIDGEVPKIDRIRASVAVQDSINNYAFMFYQNISLNGKWETFSWDLSWVRNVGIKTARKFYVVFQFAAKDSCYIGGDIVVRNLRGINNDGKTSIIDFSIVTTVPEVQLPKQFALEQNYPNPFNPSTTIRYSVPRSSEVSLKVYNLLGKEVATLFAGFQQAGNYVSVFNGRDLSSGIYLYKLQMGNLTETKRMVLLK